MPQKLAQLAGSIYAYGSERFGVKEKKATERTFSNLSRRQKEIYDIRAKIRTVSKHWKQARKKGDVIEMGGLDEIREQLRRLKSLRKVECSKRKRKEGERKRKRKRFFSEPIPVHMIYSRRAGM